METKKQGYFLSPLCISVDIGMLVVLHAFKRNARLAEHDHISDEVKSLDYCLYEGEFSKNVDHGSSWNEVCIIGGESPSHMSLNKKLPPEHNKYVGTCFCQLWLLVFGDDLLDSSSFVNTYMCTNFLRLIFWSLHTTLI